MKSVVACLFGISLSALLSPVSGAIPSGDVNVGVASPANRVWDVSSIPNLQSLDYTIYNSGDQTETEIMFDAPFVQNGAGKLVGTGPTHVEVTSSSVNASFDGVYKVSGSITSARGIARMSYKATGRGNTFIEGRTRTLATTTSISAKLDNTAQTVSGVQTATGAASGLGGIKGREPLDTTWDEIVAAMGDGSWSLAMTLQNDGVKKISGTAEVTLSSGAQLTFNVKGTYNAKTDKSLLVLVPDTDSKGSSLRINLMGSVITAIKGKLSGQAVTVVY